jgi:hypothetical protein
MSGATLFTNEKSPPLTLTSGVRRTWKALRAEFWNTLLKVVRQLRDFDRPIMVGVGLPRIPKLT